MTINNSNVTTKKLRHLLRNTTSHWVGNGFPVRSLFTYSEIGPQISPFLLFDYAGPANFPPTEKRLGVGEHPHRGFETVTIVYDGEVEHRDSSGGGGKIGPGDVQWMTAASGIVHEEFHGQDYARKGGPFEMVQLWINLPSQYKMSQPRYQSIVNSQIPVAPLPGDHGAVRVIAGEFNGIKGPAQTFSPIQVWDMRTASGQTVDLKLTAGHSAVLAVLKGSVSIIDTGSIGEAEVAIFDQQGDHIRFKSEQDTTALLLSGQPLGEPIVGSGPFVMNTADEIRQAKMDYLSGKMGQLVS